MEHLGTPRLPLHYFTLLPFTTWACQNDSHSGLIGAEDPEDPAAEPQEMQNLRNSLDTRPERCSMFQSPWMPKW